MADLKGKEMDLKSIADGLAVDSRKASVTCVDLAHRIEQALLDLQQQTERRVRRETLESKVVNELKKSSADLAGCLKIFHSPEGKENCDPCLAFSRYEKSFDALKNELATEELE